MFGMKKIPANIAALGTLGVLIAAMAFAGGCGTKSTDAKTQSSAEQEVQKDADAVCYLDGDPVSTEEYALLAQKHKNDILMRYSTDQVNQPDFWEQEINGEVPYKQLETVIEKDLKEKYSIKHLAVKEKAVDDYSFSDLKQFMEKENNVSEDSTDSSENYGLKTYDMSTYYDYWYSNLETSLINKMVTDADLIKVTDADCKSYYKTAQDNFTYDVGVEIVYVEVSETEDSNAIETAQQLADQLQTVNDTEELSKQYPQAQIQQISLNSLDTQEGLSGVYLNRWNIASGLAEGEIYGPYEDQGAVCVMKCLSRTEHGVIAYDQVKDQIQRYLQMNQAQNYIDENKDSIKVTTGSCSAKDVIIQTLTK